MILRGTTPTGMSAAGFVAVVMLGALGLPLLPAWTQPAAPPVQHEIANTGSTVEHAQAHEPDPGVQPHGLSAQLAISQKRPEKRIQLQKRYEPWPATLDWLANQTGMGVSIPFFPAGNFTYIGPAGKDTYTVPEIVDILNEQLLRQQKPCILIRGVRQWRLIPLPTTPAQRIDPSLLPRVTAQELKEHGETEIVALSYQLDVLSANHIATEYAKTNNPLRNLMASYGELIAIPGSNQLVLRDTVANLKNVVYYLAAAERAEKEKTASESSKEELTTEQITLSNLNAIVVRGTPEQIKAVKEALTARRTTPVDPEQRMKRLEDKVDTLLREVDALRKERRSEGTPRDRQRP
jgi:hypothetical protein